MGSVKTGTDRLKEEISGRFQTARKALGLSPPALAKKIGAAAQTIRDYENGKSIPGGEALAGLAGLGVNVDFVLTGNGQVVLIETKALSVREPEAQYKVQRRDIDPVLLQGVIDFFYAWLDEHKDRVRIDRSRYGAVISVLYAVADRSGVIRKAELEQVLSLAA